MGLHRRGSGGGQRVIAHRLPQDAQGLEDKATAAANHHVPRRAAFTIPSNTARRCGQRRSGPERCRERSGAASLLVWGAAPDTACGWGGTPPCRVAVVPVNTIALIRLDLSSLEAHNLDMRDQQSWG
jgi:hypothetical protein